MQSRVERFAEGLLEAGWLTAVITTPLFFNIHSARVFEPDKLALLRSVALIMAVALIMLAIIRLAGVPGRRSDPEARPQFHQRLLPAAVLLLAVVYIVATALSLVPRLSLLGSYQRFQGTYTTLSYVLIFTSIAVALRTHTQFRRLITTVILTSIPVSLYAMMQHYGLDPLPWGGDVQRRVAGNLGNSIFVAAYLIMVVPLTLSRILNGLNLLLTARRLTLLRMASPSIYVFALAIQLIAILWTNSRGPLLGLAVAIFAFVLLFLVSIGRQGSDERKLTSAGFLLSTIPILLGLLIPFVLVAGRASETTTPLAGILIVVASIFLVSVGVLLLAWYKKTRPWAWLSWLLLAASVASLVGFMNTAQVRATDVSGSGFGSAVRKTFADWRALPELGRYGSLLESGSGTGRVRVLIWEGALDLIGAHEPIRFPDGSEDSLNAIRSTIGYGPETMYVAYARFYDPELATIEKRNAAPDRSHNETLDSLVITGWVGFVSWQLLFMSVFYVGFRYLRVVSIRRDKYVFVLLWIAGAIAALLALVIPFGAAFMGVAIPFGSMFGVLSYLAYFAATQKGRILEGSAATTRGVPLIAIGLLTAVLAHYAEINFGIAIAATRTHFFVYAGIITVLAARPGISAEIAPVPLRRSKGRARWRTAQASHAGVDGGILAEAFVVWVILGTLAYDYVRFVLPQGTILRSLEDIPSISQILWQSFFLNPLKEMRFLPFVAGIILLTWLVGTVVLYRGERGGAPVRANSRFLWSSAIAFIVFLAFASLLAMQTRSQFITPSTVTDITSLDIRRAIEADAAGRYVVLQFAFIYVSLAAFATAHAIGGQRQRPAGNRDWSSLAAGSILLVIALMVAAQVNIKPIRSDIVFKRGSAWDSQATSNRDLVAWDSAIAVYRTAADLVPTEDHFDLWLGRALLEKSSLATDPVRRAAILAEAETVLSAARQKNPLNPDHTANLARLNTRWAELSDGEARLAKAAVAASYYDQALDLNPNNSLIRNEYARLKLVILGDCAGAMRAYEASLAVDPYFQATYKEVGDAARSCAATAADQDQVGYAQIGVDALKQLVERYPRDIDGYLLMADLQAKTIGDMGGAQDSINSAAAVDGASMAPWQVLYTGASIFNEAGAVMLSKAYAEMALDIAPPANQETIREFIGQLGV